jgi:tRNA threonylcarbamoyladenosine biosynthesis protein TsaB
MTLLAFETSSNTCSIGLMKDNQRFLRHELLPQQHGNVALNWVQEILKEAKITVSDLSAIAFSCGPGSFTGIRIGAAIAYGLARPYDIRLISVPSLCVFAQGIYHSYGYKKVIALIDARMKQAYYGCYVLGSQLLMEPQRADALINQESIASPGEGWVLVTDLVDFEIFFTDKAHFSNVITQFYPNASDVISLAQNQIKKSTGHSFEQALPVYLRGEDSWRGTS